jgi:hypothetical protein
MNRDSVTIKIRQSSFEKLKQLATHEDRSQLAIVSRLIDEEYARVADATPEVAHPTQKRARARVADDADSWSLDLLRPGEAPSPAVLASIAAVRASHSATFRGRGLA